MKKKDHQQIVAILEMRNARLSMQNDTAIAEMNNAYRQREDAQEELRKSCEDNKNLTQALSDLRAIMDKRMPKYRRAKNENRDCCAIKDNQVCSYPWCICLTKEKSKKAIFLEPHSALRDKIEQLLVDNITELYDGITYKGLAQEIVEAVKPA